MTGRARLAVGDVVEWTEFGYDDAGNERHRRVTAFVLEERCGRVQCEYRLRVLDCSSPTPFRHVGRGRDRKPLIPGTIISRKDYVLGRLAARLAVTASIDAVTASPEGAQLRLVED